MNVFRSILASIVTLALLASVAPTAQADVAVQPPVCQHIVTGPDIHFGACADPTAECSVWTYNYGGDTCYAPGAGAVPRAHCEQLLVGPDIDQGVCYDLDGQYVAGMNCVVWWYSTYSTGQDACYVPYPPGAVATSTAPLACVGDETAGVCYEPDDGDRCDAYATFHHGNYVCLVPATACLGDEAAGVCYEPDDGDRCDVYVTFHHGNYVCVVPDLAASTAGSSAGAVAPPRAFCQQVLVGPDIDQGVCYDLDGQYVAGMNCIVWWYSTYSTGQDRCYVPYPPGAVAASAAPPRAHCERILYGPDIDQGVCYDLDGEQVNGRECLVWWYAKYGTGTTTCYVPQPVTSTIDETCYHVADNPEARSVCHDLSRDTCQVWAETSSGDRCLT